MLGKLQGRLNGLAVVHTIKVAYEDPACVAAGSFDFLYAPSSIDRFWQRSIVASVPESPPSLYGFGTNGGKETLGANEMKVLRLLLFGAVLLAAPGVNAAEEISPNSAQETAHQMLQRAQNATDELLAGTSFSVRKDKRDFVVEFRVADQGENPYAAIGLFLDVLAELAEREKENSNLSFSPDTPCAWPQLACKFVPVPLAPMSSMPISVMVGNQKIGK